MGRTVGFPELLICGARLFRSSSTLSSFAKGSFRRLIPGRIAHRCCRLFQRRRRPFFVCCSHCCLQLADTMNLRSEHTRSQRAQAMERLAEQVVNAAVNPRKKAPKKKPRVAPRKKGRSALSQSQRSAPASSPPRDIILSSLAASNLIEKERVQEQLEERSKSTSIVESPPRT